MRECKLNYSVLLDDGKKGEKSFDYKIKKVKKENGIEYRIEEGDEAKFDAMMEEFEQKIDL